MKLMKQQPGIETVTSVLNHSLANEITMCALTVAFWSRVGVGCVGGWVEGGKVSPKQEVMNV